MKRRASVALATTVLLLGAFRTLGGAPSPTCGCSCPQTSIGWVLFEDSNDGVPEFWWQDSLEVQEISMCAHGITFVFLASERENLYVAGLVFVNPSGPLAEQRQRIELDGMLSGHGYNHYEERYSFLRDELERLSGGRLGSDGLIDFRMTCPVQRPVIINPARKLSLRWGTEEIVLRGYLDVFFNSIT